MPGKVLIANIISPGFSKSIQRELGKNIIFSSSDANRVLLHDNDFMVINVHHDNWDIKRVLINPERSIDILLWSFQKL